MNIKELLTKPHFIVSEYLGEFIDEEEYKSIRKGTLLKLDENLSQDLFIQTFSLFVEEWASVIDLFEEFVNEFYVKAHTSCWIHRCNIKKIGNEGTNSIDTLKRYLKAHSFEEYQLLHIKQLIRSCNASFEKFNDALDRFNKYLTAHSNIQKMADIAKNIDANENKYTSEHFKPLAEVMNELTNIIDEYNISKFDNGALKEFYDTCMLQITAATEIIEMIEYDVVDDEENLLDTLKTNSAKLKLMVFQLRQYLCQD